MSEPIELRSDTFTRPTAAMRAAIAQAEVGDDMVGEDPTVNRLEARMAQLLGKEAAVFACSGTQANQMAVWAHCDRGEELLIEETGHIANYESGAPAVLSGVTVRRLTGECGRLDLPHVTGQVRRGDDHFAATRLLCLENSTNIGGGRTYSLEQAQRVCHWARTNDILLHLDGARLFNACIARGYSAAEFCQPFDTVSVCFSKGLGCPMGSILAGSRRAITRARKARRVMGGALRQTGIVAAAALYALDHHVDRLTDDHANARAFADAITDIPGIQIRPEDVETNLVFFDISSDYGSGAKIAAALGSRGVRLYAIGPQRLRACTHLDVTRAQLMTAAEILRDVMSRAAAR